MEKLRAENKQLTEDMGVSQVKTLAQRLEKAVEEKDVFQRGYEQKSLKLDQTQIQHDAVSCLPILRVAKWIISCAFCKGCSDCLCGLLFKRSTSSFVQTKAKLKEVLDEKIKSEKENDVRKDTHREKALKKELQNAQVRFV